MAAAGHKELYVYPLLGLKTCLKYGVYSVVICALLALCAGALVDGAMPQLTLELIFSKLEDGLASTFTFIALGQSKLFPWACRHAPLKSVFPDLDGKWDGLLASNFAEIARRDPELQSLQVTKDSKAEVTIKARFLTISMNLRSEAISSSSTSYVNSNTVLVGVARNEANNVLQLMYLYRADANDYLPTDSANHLGAAVLDLSVKAGLAVLSGPYWTNRNWKAARNTAGFATFTRRAP